MSHIDGREALIDYASSHRFTVNEALGVVEVRDAAALERIQSQLEQARLAPARP